MEEALQQLETDQQSKRNNYLSAGVALSVVFHIACTALLFGLPEGSPGTRSITYIDLTMPQHQAAAPMTAPAKPTPPAVADKPVPPPITKVPPHAETAPPEAARQTQPVTPPPAATEAAAAKAEPQSTFGFELSKGYFKSLAEGESLRDDVKGYYLDMLQKINETWWMDQQVDKRRINPVVLTLTVARNGQIVEARLLRGSGNPRYDKAILSSLAAAGPLPPLPASYEMDFFEAPIRLVPPTTLMSW